MRIKTLGSRILSVVMAVIMSASLALSPIPGFLTKLEAETVNAENVERKEMSLPITIRDLHEDNMIYGVSGTISHRPMHVGELYTNARKVTQKGIVYSVPNYVEANGNEHVKYLKDNYLNYDCVMAADKDSEYSQYFTQDFRKKLRDIITKNNISKAAWDTTDINTNALNMDEVRTANEAAVWILDHIFIDGSFALGKETIEYSKTYPKYEKIILQKRNNNVNGDEILCYGYNSCTKDKQPALTVFDTANKTIYNDNEKGAFQGDLGWFPLNKEVIGETDFANLTFGYEAGEEKGHNYFTSTHGSGQFVYHAADELFFEFFGDDDVLLYINDRLAFDGGALQNGALYDVYMEDIASNGKTVATNLGLVEGQVYSFDFYQIERCHSQSAFTIHTNINVLNPSAFPEKHAYDSDGKKLDYGAIVPQNEDLTYEFVLTNNSALGMDGVTDLTFEDALLGVKLTKDNLEFGPYTEIDDLVVKGPGEKDYQKITERQLKRMLSKGLDPTESIAIKGFNYNSGDKELIIDNTVNTTALGKAMNSDDTYLLKGSADMLLYVPDYADFNLNVAKILTGDTLKANQFSFTLTPVDNTPGKAQTVKNAADGTVTFDTLSFGKEGTYSYTVHEEKSADNNYLYDESVYKLVFEIGLKTDKSGYEILNKTITKDGQAYDSDTLSFSNSRRGSAKVNLIATKSFDGQNLTDGQFTFTLTPLTAPEGVALGEQQTVKNDANGNIAFNELVLNTEGKYTYQIAEVRSAQDDGIYYDKEVYTVEVTVTVPENNKDNYQYTVAYKNADGESVTAMQFANEVRDPAEITLKANKTLKDENLTDGQFSFILTPVSAPEGVTLGKEQTVKNDANGNIVFDKLTFNRKGIYTYLISEVKGADGNYIYSENKYNVAIEVDVTDDEKGYEITKTTVNGEPYTEKTMTFENKHREPAEVVVAAKKILDDKASSKEFTFVLDGKDCDGNDIHQEVKNNTSGEITFDKLYFDKEGTYTYTISEMKDTYGDSIVYDEVIYEATVKVTIPNDNLNPYNAVVTYKKVGATDSTTELEFINKTRQPASLALSASKLLEGEIPESGEFQFQLEGDLLDAPQIRTTDEKGIVTFDTLLFNESKEYHYTISEVKGADVDIIYDKTVYDVIVKVEPSKTEAKYVVSSVTYKKDNTEVKEVKFENATRAHGFATIEAEKFMDDTLAEAGLFTFQLIDAEGNIVEIVENKENGKIEFTALEFGAEGTYNFTISEILGEDEKVVYDDTAYEVIVAVTVPEDDSAYVTEVSYALASEAVEKVNFENKTRESAVVSLEAAKTLDGKLPDDGQFKFVLKDEDNNEIQTVTNAEDGSIVFDELSFDESGTYNYTITEVDTKDKDIIYDEAVYEIQIEVTSDIESKDAFQADVTITKDGEEVETIDFANETVKKVVNVKTGDNSTPIIWGLAAVLSLLVALFVVMLKRRRFF